MRVERSGDRSTTGRPFHNEVRRLLHNEHGGRDLRTLGLAARGAAVGRGPATGPGPSVPENESQAPRAHQYPIDVCLENDPASQPLRPIFRPPVGRPRLGSFAVQTSITCGRSVVYRKEPSPNRTGNHTGRASGTPVSRTFASATRRERLSVVSHDPEECGKQSAIEQQRDSSKQNGAAGAAWHSANHPRDAKSKAGHHGENGESDQHLFRIVQPTMRMVDGSRPTDEEDRRNRRIPRPPYRPVCPEVCFAFLVGRCRIGIRPFIRVRIVHHLWRLSSRSLNGPVVTPVVNDLECAGELATPATARQLNLRSLGGRSKRGYES